MLKLLALHELLGVKHGHKQEVYGKQLKERTDKRLCLLGFLLFPSLVPG